MTDKQNSNAVERFISSPSQGLDTSVVEQRAREGKTNKIKKVVGKSYLAIFTTNIFTFFNLLGIMIFVLMLFCGSVENMMFFVVILLNTGIGIFQEIRSKMSVEKLALMQQPTAVIVRNGQRTELSVDDIVLDDIVELSQGKQICVDGEILQGEIEVNESMLTGESEAIKKRTGDTVYAGSFVVAGNCVIRADKVGHEKYVEQLAARIKKFKRPNSELMRSIQTIIKFISWIIFPLGLATLLTSGKDLTIVSEFQAALKVASGSMIGMVPSGMVLLTSVALAVSMLKLGRKKVLVQELYCIEMLARVDTLCVDKTGTITDGSMSVVETAVIDLQFKDKLNSVVASLLNATKDDNLTAQALAKHFESDKLIEASVCVPFSSKRKYSLATLRGVGTIALGAGEFLMNLSEDLKIRERKYLEKGCRVIYLAHSNDTIANDTIENLKPIAMIVLEDTIRRDAPEIIDWFKQNNVAVKVISGDNPLSVSVIAAKVGIKNADKFVSLDGLTDEEVAKAADAYTVFGRVSPAQKALLVKSMKQEGHTVAMMGDGVNDILAMKESDCSVSVACGSDAAKSVAQLVLTDNQFGSMPAVVAEGRQVVNNIQNSSSLFLMKTSMTILTTIMLLFLPQHSYPFQAQNLYAMEFFVIGIASFLLALKPNRNLIEGKFISNVLWRTLPSGIAMFFSIVMTYAFSSLTDIAHSPQQITTVAMFSMTATGVAALLILLFPYDKFNVGIAALSVTGTVGCYIVFPPVLSWLSLLLTGKDTQDKLFVEISDTAILFIVLNAVIMFGVMIVVHMILRYIEHQRRLKQKGELTKNEKSS